MKKSLILLAMLYANHALAAVPDVDTQGKNLFGHHCSTCHALPDPKRLDWPHWKHILAIMEMRMAQRHIQEPSRDAWKKIADYLQHHAR